MATAGRPPSRRLGVHVRRAELHPRDVAHPQHRPVRIGADDDVAELLGRGQPALGLDVELELLVVRDRRAPMRPTGACTFCAWIAPTTSDGVRLRLISRSTSNQMRME
jgi:hypothetical protein